jgi:hypothetical protein
LSDQLAGEIERTVAAERNTSETGEKEREKERKREREKEIQNEPQCNGAAAT